ARWYYHSGERPNGERPNVSDPRASIRPGARAHVFHGEGFGNRVRPVRMRFDLAARRLHSVMHEAVVSVEMLRAHGASSADGKRSSQICTHAAIRLPARVIGPEFRMSNARTGLMPLAVIVGSIVAAMCSWAIPSAFGAAYYVDYSLGSNANGGSEASPWKTPPGAACVPGGTTCQAPDAGSGWHALASGDSIFLKAGESFPMIWFINGQNFPASPPSPITIGRYGSGPDPIIEGGETIPAPSWRSVSPNVYAVPFDASVKLYTPGDDKPHVYRSGIRWAKNGTIDNPSSARAAVCTDISSQGEMFFDP